MMKRPGAVLAAVGILTVMACRFALTSDEPIEAEAVEAIVKESFSYEDHGRRNPFVPLIIPKIPTPTPGPNMPVVPIDENTSGMATPTPTPIMFPSLEIESIIYFKTRDSVAVVNNALLHEGDSVDDCEVVMIEPETVTFRYMGEERVFEASSSRKSAGGSR